uniref:Uncharacterized protein n=1 Tax=Anguilla anguilla TaxID=7936 RepID=A0A0E9T9L2_ANGAN
MQYSHSNKGLLTMFYHELQYCPLRHTFYFIFFNSVIFLETVF